MDWKKCADLLAAQGMAPLAFFNIQRSGLAQRLAPRDLEQLKQRYYLSLSKDTLYARGIAEVTRKAHKQNIGILFFKGFALSRTAYPSPETRAMTDVDILVRPEDLPRIKELMRSLEFSLEPCHRSDDPRRTAAFSKPCGSSLTLFVDIHTAVAMPRPCPVTLDLWNRSITFEFEGVTGHTCSAEDALLINFLHIRSNTRRLTIRGFCDIAFLLRAYPQIDWQYVTQQAHSHHLNGLAYFCLQRARFLFPQDIPAAAAAAFRTTAAKRLLFKRYIQRSCARPLRQAEAVMLRGLFFDSLNDPLNYVRAVARR